MNRQLPTFTSASWTVSALLDSLKSELQADTSCKQLYLLAYAVTLSGWEELRHVITTWKSHNGERTVAAYVGTDHALTDPEALRKMRQDGIAINLMTTYSGIFHPKVLWLSGPRHNLVWVGSNNVTRDGLLHNIEFATLIKSAEVNPDLQRWLNAVQHGSEPLTDRHLTSYETERRTFAAKRAETGTFTWSMRKEPAAPPSPPTPPAPTATPTPPVPPRILRGVAGDLVVEVMPLETGLDGKQMQLPKAAVVGFFGLTDAVGASRRITLTPIGTTARRTLTMTLFGNNTARLSINELDYRDRPCVIVFRRTTRAEYEFEIVRQSIYPDRYRRLLTQCTDQTRAGSRRWGLL